MARTDDDSWEITGSVGVTAGPKTLQKAGFDFSAASARSAEGLLPFLARCDRRPPADIEDAAPRSLFVSAQRS